MNSQIIKFSNVAIVWIIIFTWSQCKTVGGATRHGWEGVEYANTYLSVQSPLGSKAFQNWCDFDIDVRAFFRDRKKPDVVYSQQMAVAFFYLKEGLQVNFTRPAIGFKTKYETSSIESNLLTNLNKLFN
jgi:hypothetical protein